MIAVATRQWLYPALIAGLLTGLGGYLHNDKDLSSRVSKLEAHREDDTQKLDHIQAQVDRLVGWAIGK